MLIVQIGYDKFLFDEEALPYIRSAIKVDEKYFNGETVFVGLSKEFLTGKILVIEDRQIKYDCVPEDAKEIEKETITSLSQEVSRLQKYWSEELAKTAALTAELKVYKETCPHSKDGA